jgi:hypothetical protein
MDQPAMPSKLRPWLIAGSILVLLIWAYSLTPILTEWNNPKAQGWFLIPIFWTTVGLLPFGIVALIDSLRGDKRGIANARLMLIIAAALWTIVGLAALYGKYLEMTHVAA